VGDKIKVKVFPGFVEKMRAKAIADGVQDADTIPDEELLTALIRVELGQPIQPTGRPPRKAPSVEEPPTDDGSPEQPPRATDEVRVTSPEEVVWVRHDLGVNLRDRPVNGEVVGYLPDMEKLLVIRGEGDWLEVRTTDGHTGWVPIKFVTDVDPNPPIPPKGNVRGIHGSAGMAAPPRHLWGAWIHELKTMGMAWYKQLDAGDPNDVGGSSTFSWAMRLKQNGIEPIIRYYQHQMFPGGLHDQAFKKMERYAAEGIVWAEIGNEPNLDQVEWNSRYHGKLSWQNPYFPRIIVEHWIRDAERAVSAGARPGFYALAPTDWGAERPHRRLSSVMFYRRMFEYVVAHPDLHDRFVHLFEPHKAWLAVHSSTYGLALDFDPFPSDESPYDMCLRGYEVPLLYLRQLVLGDVPVTVISTEGGVFTKGSSSLKGHVRPSSHEEHAQRTVEMFAWIQEHSPLQAMCPWLICNVFQAIGHHDPSWAQDGWYDGGPPGFSPKPVVQAMKETKAARQEELT
jgi:hypothetical protein